MRKLVESTFMTLDGVISRPQDWSGPYWDDEHTGYAEKLLEPADALLLGRETYEVFAASWPEREGAYAERLNAMPKHVASRTLTETTWNATLIEGDAAEGVAALKEQDGGDILKYGTGELDKALAARQLVDEFHFWVFPVVAGQGDRLFDGLDLTTLKLVETDRFASGIVVLVYTHA
ncbi:MAG TPA: dihydrofolate reductase family protein [Gaiellaceae bacterium]|jgi:dihydrofolate reductase|nr:dihydrofolate reductase family protein [Gaiellaceae bacterium]